MEREGTQTIHPIAARLCRLCNTPIGIERPFYDDHQFEGQYVHADCMERLAATETQPAVRNQQSAGNSRWQRWEISCLLGACHQHCRDGQLDGQLLDRLAVALGRTAAAVQSEYARLLDGTSTCPANDAAMLHDLRARRQNRQVRPAARRPRGESWEAMLQQYRNVASKLEHQHAQLHDIRAAALAGLAMSVAAGELPLAGLSTLMPERTMRAVSRLADDIRRSRTEPQPLIMTGQGSGERTVSEADIQHGKGLLDT